MKFNYLYLFLCLFTPSFFVHAQDFEIVTPPEDWHNMDMRQDVFPGTSVERTYKDLLQGLEGKKVVVAVIDSGVDIYHEDLSSQLWVNPDEHADNGEDDDGNGYVDDIHGWSFIGGSNGDVRYDNLEFTRHYKKLKDEFEGMDEKAVPSAKKEKYKEYLSYKEQYERRMSDTRQQADEYEQIVQFYEFAKQTLEDILGKEDYSLEDLSSLDASSNEMMMAIIDFMTYAIQTDFESSIEEGRRHFMSAVEYAYNLDYDSREIIGDDISNPREKHYGNNNVKGPSPGHGTHVAGIIAADRSNDLGIKGICENAEIMVLRVVPDGDERDKDVANAIRYAADNGAQIINMSFGKSLSPHKLIVDEAMHYAEKKGVLMVHAAGNSDRNNDKSPNFPNPVDEITREISPYWIEVGASGWNDATLAASFTNYGKKSVDIFAPGVSIYSTLPESEYGRRDGTSMSAPVVSGVAALLMSYFPDLKAKDVKNIIVNSYVDYGKVKVTIPGESKQTKFKKLCRTGGVINAYNAVKMAQEYESSSEK